MENHKFEKAKLAIKDRLDIKEAFAKIKNYPTKFRVRFHEILENDPNIDSNKLLNILSYEYWEWREKINTKSVFDKAMTLDGNEKTELLESASSHDQLVKGKNDKLKNHTKHNVTTSDIQSSGGNVEVSRLEMGILGILFSILGLKVTYVYAFKYYKKNYFQSDLDWLEAISITVVAGTFVGLAIGVFISYYIDSAVLTKSQKMNYKISICILSLILYLLF